MLKEFNTTGICIPEKHYMVDISDRLTPLDTAGRMCFNKNKEPGVKRVRIGDRVLYEATV